MNSHSTTAAAAAHPTECCCWKRHHSQIGFPKCSGFAHGRRLLRSIFIVGLSQFTITTEEQEAHSPDMLEDRPSHAKSKWSQEAIADAPDT